MTAKNAKSKAVQSSTPEVRLIFSVVVPAYKEAANLKQLYEEIVQSLAPLRCTWERIIVDDGSPNRTWECIVGLQQRDFRVRGVPLFGNFGDTSMCSWPGSRRREGLPFHPYHLVHMLPQGIQICAQLAHEFGVSAVRLSDFRLSEMIWPLRPKPLALAPFAPTAREVFERRGIFSNRWTLEIPSGNPDLALWQVCRTLERLDAGVHELTCHPAYEDSMLEARYSYVAGRHNELTILEHANPCQFLVTAGIEQTTFRDPSASFTQKDEVFD
jgi:hypothetical protein